MLDSVLAVGIVESGIVEFELNWNCSIYWQIKLKRRRKIIKYLFNVRNWEVYFCVYIDGWGKL